MRAIESDASKILSFTLGPTQPVRWVIGIAYSIPVKTDLTAYQAGNPGAAFYGESNTVGVIVIDAWKLK
jgi:hypothetical protein